MAGIDRDYWLDFAKENITKSIQSREDAASKLDDFLSWLWTIYTSVFALASLLGYVNNNTWLLILVSQPILVIILARFACRLVSMPGISDSPQGDPNVVPEIIEGFITIVETKRKKLMLAVIATIIAIVSLCAALVGYNLFDPYKSIKQEIQKATLTKELSDKTVKPVKAIQNITDSIRLINDSMEAAIQNEIKKKKLDCIRSGNTKCIDTVIMLGR